MLRKLSILVLSLFALAATANTAEANIRSKLKTLMPELPIDSISPTPVQGLYQIKSDANIIYITDDGKYIIQGDMYDVQKEENVVNLTEVNRQEGIKKLLDEIDTSTLITYPAKNETTYITVVTDIDCTYCRALHKEVTALNQAGITVRYLAFPRTPKGTSSYDKAISVWCADDRNAAYSSAIAGNEPEKKTCTTHPVDAHRLFVEKIGGNVTPIIILRNGRMIPGYLPSDKLIEAIKQFG